MHPFEFALSSQVQTHEAVFAGLNPLDWVLVLLLASSTFMAFFRGLIQSVISLIGVVLGILLAAWYAPAVATKLAHWVAKPAVADVIAFALIVFGCFVVAALIGRLLRGAAKAVGLGLLDRVGGAAFGFARGVVILAAIIVFAGPFLPLVPFTRESVILPYLRTAAHGVCFVVPQDFGDRLPAGARSFHLSAPVSKTRSPGQAHRTNQSEAPPEGEAQ